MAAVAAILLISICFGFVAFIAEWFGLLTKRQFRAFFATASIVAGGMGFWYVSLALRNPIVGFGVLVLGIFGAAVVQPMRKSKVAVRKEL